MSKRKKLKNSRRARRAAAQKLHLSRELQNRAKEAPTVVLTVGTPKADSQKSELKPKKSVAVEAPPLSKTAQLVRGGAFFAALLVLTVVAWILPLRPDYSEMEQRPLSKFPAFSLSALVSGTYFDDINLWFADTFPARETWVALQSDFKRLYALSDEKLYGAPVQPDEIPDAPTRPSAEPTEAPPPATENSTVATKPSKDTTVPTTTTTTAKPTKPTKTTNKNGLADTDIWNETPSNTPTQTLNGVLVRGDSAFEYYSFLQGTADEYVAAINRATQKIGGKAKVYSMIVPTSIGVMLPQEVRDTLTRSDQKKAIDYLYGSMNDAVATVPIIDTLRAHSNEYLYFHSDHHWTARGAYYAYAELMKVQGKKSHKLSEYESQVFDGFYGSFYAETQDKNLKKDTVTVYYPLCGGSMFFEDADGVRTDWPIIQDVTDWSARYKYNTFIGGDNAYTEIDNPKLSDGSSILVVKESFGNALVPFLVDHYDKVYVVDYRHYTKSDLATLVTEKKVSAVVFINNVSATRNSGLVEDLGKLVG